jgi:hypothetical protein
MDEDEKYLPGEAKCVDKKFNTIEEARMWKKFTDRWAFNASGYNVLYREPTTLINQADNSEIPASIYEVTLRQP